MGSIRVAYLDNFKGSDTLLLEGDVAGLDALAEALEQLAAGAVVSMSLQSLPFLSSRYEVRARCAQKDVGISRNTGGFCWDRTREGWSEVVEKIRALSACGHGHQYLDATDDELVVMASSGEGYERVAGA